MEYSIIGNTFMEGFMQKWKRIVIKTGTTSLTHPNGTLNIRRVEKLAKVICDIANSGAQIIFVSSGAISMGVGKLGLHAKPSDMAGKQACAAVGQCELMYTYDKLFSEYNRNIAQILLTGEDLSTENRLANFRNTMNRLLEFNVIPVLNENDTVATEEIASIGDNDTLASLVSVNCQADLLILFSDIDGVYTSDPHTDPDAKLIPEITEIDGYIESLASDSVSGQGTGGMITKINAAKTCMSHGIDMIIANGQNPDVLYDIMDGKKVGTFFQGKKE